MKKTVCILLAALMLLSLCSCGAEKPQGSEHEEAVIFPKSDALVGDTMPFFENGKMYIYYLADQRDGKLGYHPWALLRTEDYWNYEDLGVVLPYGADAHDQGESGCVRKQQIEVFRIGLQVGVDIAGVRRFTGLEPRFQRGAQSAVAGEAQEEEIGMAGADLLDQGAPAIGRTIVHQQDAGGPDQGFFQISGKAVFQPEKAFPFVVDRDDDGKLEGSRRVHATGFLAGLLLRKPCKVTKQFLAKSIIFCNYVV